MNDFRKKVAPRPKIQRSAVEAVKLYGDDWRLIGRTRYGNDHEWTMDFLEATSMRMMERGEIGRIEIGTADE